MSQIDARNSRTLTTAQGKKARMGCSSESSSARRQTISSDPAKLKVYCDMGKLQEQIEEADQKKDKKEFEALSANATSLLQQISPEYLKIMEGLEQIDPESAEGKEFAAVFGTLDKQCK